MIFYEDETKKGIEFLNGSFPLREIQLRKDLARGTITLNGLSRQEAWRQARFLRVVVSHLLLPNRGFFVHAAGIEEGGRGLLFVGPKRAGKSTLSKLFHQAGGTVLSDEQVIVRKSKGRLWIFGTPWPSTFRLFSLKKAPLRALFFLRHGSHNKVREAKGRVLLRHFLGELLLPPWEADRLPLLQSLPLELLSRIPAYLLSFRPTQAVVPFVRNVLRRHAL